MTRRRFRAERPWAAYWQRRKGGDGKSGLIWLGFTASLLTFGGGMLLTTQWRNPAQAETASAMGSFPCNVASITDGDTLKCNEVDSAGRQLRIRLSGISAREMDGTCSPGHPCPAATAEAATAALSRLAMGQNLQCQAVGTTYGRIAAFCQRSDGTDLSCAMVESETALRWDRHWQGHRC